MKHIYLLLLLTFAFASCKKEATVWESEWNAPIINDTLSLSNLVNDSTLSVSGGYYMMDLTRTLFDLSVNDIVAIPDTTIVQSYTSAINLPLPAGSEFWGTPEVYDLDLDDMQLKTLILRNGYVDLRLENPVETKVYFLIKLPGVSKDGVGFQQVIAAPAANGGTPGVKEATIDLSGYTLDLTGEDGGSYNQLRTDFSVTTDMNGGDSWWYDGDVVRVNATFRDASVYYAQGYFGSTEISDTTEIDLSALDVYKSGALDINNLNLSFIIENGVKVGAVSSILTVVSENSLGNSISLGGSNIGTNITVNPATGSWGGLTPSITTVTFNSSNSNIESFLENLGNKYKVGYTFKVNPWGNTSSGWDQIFPNSRISVKLKAQMPLAVGLDNLVVQDTFDISLNQDSENTRILSGDLILNARNGFPFNADVTLYLLNSSGNLMYTINGSEIIESSEYGTLDSQTGILVQPSEVVFPLSEAVVSNVNSVAKIVVKAKFNSPNPVSGNNESYLIPENAFLGVKLKTNFKTENKF